MASTSGKTFGYVRVSTKKQTVDQQMDALIAAGVPESNIFGDVRSGAKWDREGLDALRGTEGHPGLLREGDTLVVVALDRLGRSLSEMVKLLDWIVETGITLRSLREGIDLSTPTGRMLAGIFAAMAEYERALIIERAEAAREAARARGKQVGRPSKLTGAQIETARIRIDGKQSVAEVARDLEVSRATLYRALEL